MCLQTVFRFNNYTDILRLRERTVIRRRSGHIDNPFLEADNLSHSHYAGSIHTKGLSMTNFGNLTHNARENTSRTFHFQWCNTDRLSRSSKFNVAGKQTIILQHKVGKLFRIDIERFAFNLCLLAKLNI